MIQRPVAWVQKARNGRENLLKKEEIVVWCQSLRTWNSVRAELELAGGEGARVRVEVEQSNSRVSVGVLLGGESTAASNLAKVLIQTLLFLLQE